MDYVGVRPPEVVAEDSDEKVISIHDAATGAVRGEVAVASGVMAAIVGDQLILDDTPALRQTDPEHPDFYRATVTGLDLPAGEQAWSAQLLRPTVFASELDSWGIAALASTSVSTFGDDRTYTITPDGTLELVSLEDGSVQQVAAPTGMAFLLDDGLDNEAQPTWTAGERTLVPDAHFRYGGREETTADAAWVDVATGDAKVVSVPNSLPAVTVPSTGEHGPVPLWVREVQDPFGRARPHALIIDDSGDSADVRDLGRMPGEASWVSAPGDLLVAETSQRLYVLDTDRLR